MDETFTAIQSEVENITKKVNDVDGKLSDQANAVGQLMGEVKLLAHEMKNVRKAIQGVADCISSPISEWAARGSPTASLRRSLSTPLSKMQ
eukprot:8150387-Pyramimonas_sp.AAC.1